MAARRRPGPPVPEAYDEDLARAVLRGIANGTPLRVLCRAEGMPGKDTIYEWRRGLHGAPADFKERMEEARLEGADALRDEMLEIADTVAPNKDAVAKAKLRVETREKLLAKWFPQKLAVEHSGAIEYRWAANEAEAVKDVSRPTETPDDDDDDQAP